MRQAQDIEYQRQVNQALASTILLKTLMTQPRTASCQDPNVYIRQDSIGTPIAELQLFLMAWLKAIDRKYQLPKCKAVFFLDPEDLTFEGQRTKSLNIVLQVPQQIRANPPITEALAIQWYLQTTKSLIKQVRKIKSFASGNSRDITDKFYDWLKTEKKKKDANMASFDKINTTVLFLEKSKISELRLLLALAKLTINIEPVSPDDDKLLPMVLLEVDYWDRADSSNKKITTLHRNSTYRQILNHDDYYSIQRTQLGLGDNQAEAFLETTMTFWQDSSKLNPSGGFTLIDCYDHQDWVFCKTIKFKSAITSGQLYQPPELLFTLSYSYSRSRVEVRLSTKFPNKEDQLFERVNAINQHIPTLKISHVQEMVSLLLTADCKKGQHIILLRFSQLMAKGMMQLICVRPLLMQRTTVPTKQQIAQVERQLRHNMAYLKSLDRASKVIEEVNKFMSFYSTGR